MALNVSDSAPDFELLAKEAGAGAPTYRLAEALGRGPVILQFFPLPFTRVCEAQMCATRDQRSNYDRAGVTVWGMTGHYPQLIAAWDKEIGFDVPILADYDHEVSRTYVGLYEPPGILPRGLRLCTKRAVVAIDADAVVRSSWITEDPGVGPSDEVVQAALDSVRG